MAEEVAALQVRLEATQARFERDMRRAERTMARSAGAIERRAGRMNDTLTQTGRIIGVNFTALAGIFTGAALTRGFSSAIRSLDDIGKTADKIGLTTDSLQELRSAAEQTGVSAGTLDTAMQRFSRRTAEARQGTGEAKDALRELGVELNNADGSARSLDDLLNQVADGLAQTETQSDRVRLAMKLFDTEGVALVNTLGKGSQGLEDFRQRAREMGAVIREDSVRAAEDLRTEIDLLATSFSNTFVAAVGQAAKALNEFFNIGASNQLASVRREIDQMREGIAATQGQITDGSILSAGTLKDRLEGFQTRFFELRERERELLAQIQGEGATITPSVSSTPGGGGARPAGGGGGGGAAASSLDTFGDMVAQAQERIRALQEEARVIGLTAGEADRLRSAFEAEAIARELLSAAQEDGTAITDDEAAAVAQLATQYQVLAQRNIEAREATEATAAAQEQLAQNIETLESAAQNALLGLIDGTLDWKNALTQVLSVILDIARQNIQAPNVEGGGSGGIFSAIGDAIGGLFRERGGPVRRGQPYIVGERRPELFVPDQSGRILPRVPDMGAVQRGAATPSSISVGPTTINITEPGASPQEIQRIVADSRRETIREIVTMNRRNPRVLGT